MKMMRVYSIVVPLLLSACDGFVTGALRRVPSAALAAVDESSSTENLVTRRGIFRGASFAAVASVLAPQSVLAADVGGLDDLPPEAARSYLQYRMPLQTSADYYLWTLQSKVKDTNDWGEIGELFQTNSARGGGQPNRIERDFINPSEFSLLIDC